MSSVYENIVLPYDSQTPLIDCPLYYPVIENDNTQIMPTESDIKQITKTNTIKTTDIKIYNIIYYSIYSIPNITDIKNIKNYSHMLFRYRYRDCYELNVSDARLHKMITEYIDTHYVNHPFIMFDYNVMFCNITPKKMPNYLPIDRTETDNILTSSFLTDKKLSWLVRPSSIICNEYGKDNKGNIYPLIEYYVFSYYDTSINKVIHILFNKTISNIYNTFIKNDNDNTIETKYNTFGELLETLLTNIKYIIDIRCYDISTYKKNDDDITTPN